MRKTVKTVAATFLASMLAVAGVACSSQSSETQGSTGGGSDNASYYPVTVDTPQGEVTIEKEPKRVVVLNLQHGDIVSSLGIKPAVINSGSHDPKELFPWLTDEEVEVTQNLEVEGEAFYNFEKIANLDPDLIVSNSFSLQKRKALID